MKICLRTPLPRLANELYEVLKLFWPGEAFAVEATADVSAEDAAKAQFTASPVTRDMEALTHTFSEAGGVWRCAFALRGETAARELPVPAGGTLAKQRLQKRLCKLTLYDLCKRLSGRQPPWGSLTGIRPTRLLYEKLAQGYTLETGTQALVEEFDLSPEKAELLKRIVSLQQTLPAPSERDADLYLSIPFCRTRCAYCSFPGEALGRGKQVGPYLEALFAEMEAAARLMREQKLVLRALYIGGGTPTALDEDAFAALMAHAAACFPNPREFTVEAGRPDTITEKKLRAMLGVGVGRISVNPQTMNDQTLRAIGRDHTAAQTAEAFLLARKLGFADINMDVIAGLPGETPGDFAVTMAAVEKLAPDSLTVHTLAIKRSSRLHLQGTALPPAGDVAEMVAMGEATAEKLGMAPYYLYRQKYMAGQQQNVGYARAGAACLYNIDIMEETATILACGAGAISKRVFTDRDLRIERAPNVTNVAEYIARADEMSTRKTALFPPVASAPAINL
ncbi:MAG: coproporphyrinogen dehydrogenase HemZ [Eubacteriales bacterium]|nr:coproporphyrinogen dehydrogenase HemZ [Eubacteriales bacterium]